MRALTRMRTLAAACALLLAVAGMASAGRFDRQIDRPGTPTSPPTTEAGEPDTGQGLVYWQQILIAAQLSNPWLNQPTLGLLQTMIVNRVSVARSVSRRGR
jgi:hypothetical protein